MIGRSREAFSAEERLARLRLARSENVGPITFHRLIERFGSGLEALAAMPALARRGGRRRPLALYPQSQAEDELAAFEAKGVALLFHGAPDYPEALAAIADAPPFLSLLGDAALPSRRCIAVVGARNASANGRRLAETLARDLGAGGFTVVSGLARGIDAAAHRGALESGTLAVVAGGLDVVYPPEHKDLHGEIAARGAVVSEMALGIEPQARHFPRRNRMISGLSLGVLVVEAAPRSGSLITARLALDQGREVFAVPGSPLDPRARGCNALLRESAHLTESAEDVLTVFDGMFRPTVDKAQPPETAPDTGFPADEQSLEPARAAVLELLAVSPVMVDELIRRCQLSPAVVNSVLLELELAGRLQRHPGNRVSLELREAPA